MSWIISFRGWIHHWERKHLISGKYLILILIDYCQFILNHAFNIKHRFSPLLTFWQYKLWTLMFDVQHGTAPVYLTELCEYCSDTYLRSSSRGDFCIPRTNLRLSDKAFSVAWPRAWNSLPTSVRLTLTKSTFCKHLKTHLFRVSYGHPS